MSSCPLRQWTQNHFNGSTSKTTCPLLECCLGEDESTLEACLLNQTLKKDMNHEAKTKEEHQRKKKFKKKRKIEFCSKK